MSKNPKRLVCLREPPCHGMGGVPLTVSWRHGQQNTSFVPAIHKHVEIQYVRHGFGWYFINGKACPFRPHTLIVINPNEPHHLVVGQQVLLRKCCLMFMPTFLRDEIRPALPLARLPRPLQLAPADSARIEWLLQQLAVEYESKSSRRTEMLRALMRTLSVVIACAASDPVRTTNTSATPVLVDQLIDYLEKNFRREITGPELQKHFGYTAGHISRLMRRHTGCGFKHFIIERRIAEARRLLRTDPQIKITAIAESVGFHSFPLFNRIFKRIAGVTARTYRGK